MINEVSVLGLGYIGLPTAAVMAANGLRVLGVDINPDVVHQVKQGKIHIVEPGLEEVVCAAVEANSLTASLLPDVSDAFVIAVPTPFYPCKKDGDTPTPDTSYIEKAAVAISKVLKKGDLVVLESTSPVGTTQQLSDWLSELRPDLSFPNPLNDMPDVFVAYCPERVLPGNVIEELVTNDRVVGGLTEACTRKACDLYGSFVGGDLTCSDAATAEMVKLTENASRDVAIAFANEVSMICENLGIDPWEMIEIANRHPRVNILQPGPGVGGHCIAVDPWFIVSKSPDLSKLIKTAREVNSYKPNWVLNKINEEVKALLNRESLTPDEVKIACYGLSFKPNIDDLRESPALAIADSLSQTHPGTLFLVEPNVSLNPIDSERSELVDFSIASESAHLHVLLVDHEEFRGAKPSKGRIFDTRGIWS